MYIRATGNISAQKTFGHPRLLDGLLEYSSNRLSCSEPDYKNFIDIKLIRRMSRIIRMGVAAAMECLQEAGIKQPDAIITATAYGCLEDTGTFLTRMVEFKEELLTPTAFIQSTHNTIGAQIGLMLQCNNYNNAFVHRGFSFESALMDAYMLLQENAADNVLVGSIDEITNISHRILERFGWYKKENISNLQLLNVNTTGTIAGEGAAFFLLANEPSSTDYAKLEGFSTFYKPADEAEIVNRVAAFLKLHGLNNEDVDLLITGKNGDVVSDKIYDKLLSSLFKNTTNIHFKQLCGDYPTATGFAVWLAANIIKQGSVPAVIREEGFKEKPLKHILIYNHFQQLHHAIFLLKPC